MEDAHSCVLDLKPEDADGNVQTDSKTRISYFGVYDGHGGDKVAIYAGENLHKIIAKQEAFKEHNFEQALKDGFLACDRAILNGMDVHDYSTMSLSSVHIKADPRYEEEVSGCTASVGVITHDKIYVVSKIAELTNHTSDVSRATLGTHEPYSESRAEPNPFRLTISPKMKVLVIQCELFDQGSG